MSTKIYDAYKLAPNADLFDLQRSLASEVMPGVWQAKYQRLLDDSLALWDERWRKDATFTLNEAFREEMGRGGPLEDSVTASAVVLRNDVRGELYMITYGELAKQGERLLQLPVVMGEFEYWNNSDHPEELTEAKWEDRALAWDEAIGKGGISALTGLTMDLVPFHRRNLDRDGLLNHLDVLVLPEIGVRINRLAQRLFMNESAEVLRSESPDFFARLMGQLDVWQSGKMDPEETGFYLGQAALTIERGELTMEAIRHSLTDLWYQAKA